MTLEKTITPQNRINELENEVVKLKEAIKNLTDATEDKDGQFKIWHQYLREATKAAKELL